MYPLLFIHYSDIYQGQPSLTCLPHIGKASLTFSAHAHTHTHTHTHTLRQTHLYTLVQAQTQFCHVRPEALSVISVCHGAVLFFSWVIYCVLAAALWPRRQTGAWHCFAVVHLQVSVSVACHWGESAQEPRRQSVEPPQFPRSGFKLLFVHVHHGGPVSVGKATGCPFGWASSE